MNAPINQEALMEKWSPLLDAEGQDKISDPHRPAVTAVLLAVSYTHMTLPTTTYV